MKTRTLAVMFTDIKGYTALTSSHSHDQNALLLRNHRRLVSPILEAFDGQLVKSIGDAFMVVFSSPTKAVQCAMAIQDRLWLHNETAKAEEQIHLRVAVNLGEMRVERRDFFGEPVNIAARMEGVTPAGEIYISEAVYLAMNRQDIPTEEVGSFEFKGIPEPVHVHSVPRYADPKQQAVRVVGPDGETAAVEELEDEPGGTEGDDKSGPPYRGAFVGKMRRHRVNRLLFFLVPALLLGAVTSVLFAHQMGRQGRERQITEIEALLSREEFADVTQLIDGFVPTTPKETLRRDAARRRLAWAHFREGEFEKAERALDWLLAEATREPQELLLQGHLAFATAPQDDPVAEFRRGLASYGEALTIDTRVGDDEDLIRNLVRAYHFKALRSRADWLVSEHVKGRASQTIADELDSEDVSFTLRHWFISRLGQLGAEELIDWVRVSIRDLEDGTCKYRRRAIEKLVDLGDQRAVGPLLKLGGERRCGSREAKAAAQQLLEQTGGSK